MFTEDKTVVPKESAWFGSEAIVDGSRIDFRPVGQHRLASSQGTMVQMREQPLYVEDWIGLRELDERGGVTLTCCEGGHMQIGGCWRDLIVQYTGNH